MMYIKVKKTVITNTTLGELSLCSASESLPGTTTLPKQAQPDVGFPVRRGTLHVVGITGYQKLKKGRDQVNPAML